MAKENNQESEHPPQYSKEERADIAAQLLSAGFWYEAVSIGFGIGDDLIDEIKNAGGIAAWVAKRGTG